MTILKDLLRYLLYFEKLISPTRNLLSFF